ncbi:DUF354 domain-containing protein [Methanocalculus sp.]|uniref:DUF354 domain-containing protein n=1 Tax=Methanocalculus sp. TaxID=2004547 RepID=UPI00262176BF|nr:DUF354 domain-containing protein [Methanocalculus sp.]MDG6250063.1 DUF354 domain-containing protein [Methanocalculus sp.]
MKILIDMGHPGHVHLFKNFIWEMESRGHEIKVIGRDKDVVIQLLDAYHIPYIKVGKKGSGKLSLIREWILREYEIYKIAKRFNPHFFLGVLNPAVVHSAKILGKKSMIFTDSEPEVVKYPIADMITLPLTDVILTLASVRHDYGRKEVRVNSYKEFASLHPNYFTPDPQVIKDAGLTPGEKFTLIRFVAWGAYHDVGQGGFSNEEKRKLIHELQKHSKVFISSESPLPSEFEQYRLPVTPDKLHDLLSYATLLVSDSQTMTTEAAVLGTPAIRCNSFVGKGDMGNFIELEEKYKLIFNYRSASDTIDKVVNLIQIPHLKDDWKSRQERLLEDKIDITGFMVWFVENYPESFTEMKNHPDVQYSFNSVVRDIR